VKKELTEDWVAARPLADWPEQYYNEFTSLLKNFKTAAGSGKVTV